MSASPVTTCKDCGVKIAQGEEKALSGEYATVWANIHTGEWVCPVTGEEHEPGEPRRDVVVTVENGDVKSMVRLSLAEAGNFVFRPINEALDDGEASWDMQEDDPERHATLARWATGLWTVGSGGRGEEWLS